MAVFKEIKKRINSVKSTRKTTSAMKLVSSAKLRKAEGLISNMLPYSEAMKRVMRAAMGTQESLSGTNPKESCDSVSIIVFSSDSSLCGAFNANICRELLKTIELYRKSVPNDKIFVYTIGKKVYDAARKAGIKITQNFENLAAKPDYYIVSQLAETLISRFKDGETGKVDMIYHHYRSAGSQELVRKQLLPVTLDTQDDKSGIQPDYIYEPTYEELLQTLIPNAIKLQLYTALLDSNASEHAARMMAMQTATDNADDLISDLTLEYNKSRQQAITNELLDLAGGRV